MEEKLTLYGFPLFLLPLGLLVLLIVWRLRFKSMVGRIFDGRYASHIEFVDIRERLEVLNAECPTHAFEAKRVAKVSVQGHPILLIYGPVSGFVPTDEGSTSTKSVFAIGEGDDIEWMRRFSDVFELAFAGSTSSIFWVKVPQLIRLTSR
jgi:hypothetical protein